MHVAFEPIHYSYHLGEWAGDAAVSINLRNPLLRPRSLLCGDWVTIWLATLEMFCLLVKLSWHLNWCITLLVSLFWVRPYLLRFYLFCLISVEVCQALCTIWTETWYFPEVRETTGGFMERNCWPLKLFPRHQPLKWGFSCPGVGVLQVSLPLHKRRLLPLIWFLTGSCPALQRVSSSLLSEG